MPDSFQQRLTQRADFRDFINHFDSVAVWSANESGINYMSPAFEDIYGRPVADVLDDMSIFVEAAHPEDCERVVASLEDQDGRVQNGEPFRMEIRIVRPDGELRWIEARIIPVRDASGEVSEVVGVTIDITDRRRTELKLERQNERLDRFAMILSHDLRNPLTTAKGYLELVTDEISHTYLDAISQGLTRIEEIITDVLTLTRVGKAAETTESIDLEKEARKAWQIAGSTEATLAEMDDLGEIEADGSLVGQLFENAFRNAIEHGGDDVTVRVGLLDERFGFYVADDGTGIPDKEQEQVFEMGYTTSDKGTGLGLLIIKEIVNAHSWDARITSSTDGGVRLEITNVKMRA